MLTEKIDPDKKSEVSASIIDELLEEIEELRPKTNTFAVQVLSKELTFRHPTSMSDIASYKKHGLEFVSRMMDKSSSKPAAIAEAIKGLNIDDFIAAFTIHFWSDSPTKLSILQALKICKSPVMTDRILRTVEKNHEIQQQNVAFTGISKAKKGSRATTSTGQGSRSAKKSTGVTPKSSRTSS